MSLTQGKPLPDVTVTTTRADAAPDYYTGYLGKLATAGQTGMQQTVAPLDVLQQNAYAAVPAAADAYKPGLTTAEETAKAAASGLDPTRIQSLMDPYRTNVVDEMARLQQQNIQRNILPGLRAGFARQGAMGSQRYAGALGQSLADMQANLTGQQYGALSKGYSEALRAGLDEAQLQNEAAKTQLGLAKGAQEMGLTGTGALTKAGAEQQAFKQAQIDAPLKNAIQAAGLLRGFTIPTTQTETRKGPLAGAYGLSPLQAASGLIGLVGSGAAGTAADRMGSVWKNLMKAYNVANQNASAGSQEAADDVYQGAGGYNTDPNRQMELSFENIFDYGD
jgi:hypothetical protein